MISHETFDLTALRDWLACGIPPAITPRPGLAVIGDPVSHSRSPGMHQPALDERGLGIGYIRLHVPPGQVGEAFRLMRGLGFTGCNVTVPHKREALDNCTAVEPSAALFQAVNTIRFEKDGGTSGWNTDGPGLAAAVEEAFSRPLSACRVAVVGVGGGAGRAAALQCALLGCPALVLVNRTRAKADAVAAEIAEVAPGLSVRVVEMGDTAALGRALAGCDLLVNASSAGMKEGDPLPVPAACLHPGLAVYDMIYSPPETRLLAAALSLGCPVSNGLSMLIHQGAIAFSHWFGGPPPVATMRRALSNP